jgi:hypothetical protein
MGVSKTFQISYSKSAQVVRRRFHAPPAKECEYPIFFKKKLKSQNPKKILPIFLDIPKEKALAHIM